MKNKTILITGGSGFIGRNLREYFRGKADIIAPSHDQLDLLSQDSVEALFREHDIDYVIHCANIGGNRKCPGPADSVARNTRMFFNILQNSRHFERLIHFGSGAEYDKSRPLIRVSESQFGERIPADDYGFAKYLMSRYIEHTENTVCLRLFGVFGKYEDYEYKFISNAILKNLLGMPITIRQNVFFDWLYIDDLMEISRYFIDHESRYTAYNVTPGAPLDLVSIAALINRASSYQSEILIETPGLNSEYSGDNERLRSEAGNLRFTSPSDAIAGLKNHYASVLPSIDTGVIGRDEYAQYCKVHSDIEG